MRIIYHFQNEISNFIYTSRYIGFNPSLIQGGGGNTSYKLDDHQMIIKASGYNLKDITFVDGYSLVDYQKIRNDIFNPSQNNFYLDKNNFDYIIKNDELANLRPSVETGFHAVLKKSTIHSHSIYSNLINCCVSSEQLFYEIFTDYPELVEATHLLPYIQPGNVLSLEIANLLTEADHNRDFIIIFLKNHGLIVSCEDNQKCIEIHDLVNKIIADYFDINNLKICQKLKQNPSGIFISKTNIISQLFETAEKEIFYQKLFKDCKKHSLYPDQLVYLEQLKVINNTPSKLNYDSIKATLDFSKHELKYYCNENMANAIDETIASVFLITSILKKHNLEINYMNQQAVKFIMNWEQEKYRKKISSKQ
ncbi:MAG: hypothetical protein GX328_03470 [Clostridiaceae bacterium]|nr:hypothetical protein [Clostridiaceae bacterium]